MKQRLLLAKTLIPEPEILLLDEPASGMDPHGRALLKDVIHKLADQGRSIIVSSHILTEMSEFCTSVGIMERGQLVLSGPVDEVSRRVLGYGLLSVGILNGTAKARSIIDEDSRAGAVREANGELEFTFDGDSEAASQILAHLVTSGVQVSSFARKTGDLEDVFLKVGAREVS
jgi:ABC-2 type transport system ATP-binding protein